jgi:extracellular elastinolytic metalloproteinase
MEMRVKARVARRTGALSAAVVTTLAVGLGQSAVPAANAAPHNDKTSQPTSSANSATRATSGSAVRDKGFYDARSGGTTAAKNHLYTKAGIASSRAATDKLRESLGKQAVVEMDGLTGTARQVARLNGFLTGKSSAPATKVAMGFVRSHLPALGLRSADLKTFRLSNHWVDVAGIHHISWTQRVGGVQVFGNGLKANVTRDGRLLSLGGSPVARLRISTASVAKVGTPVRSRAAAIAAARRDVGEKTLKAGSADYARRVLFATPAGLRRAWEAVTMSAFRPMQTVVDARDGRVLYRRDLSSDAYGSSPAHVTAPWMARAAARQAAAGGAAAKAAAKGKGSTGLAFEYFPGHKPGGVAQPVNYTKRGWLSGKAKILYGNNSHTFSDVNDDNKPNPSEEVPAKSPHKWNYRLKPFHLTAHGFDAFCDNPWPCSWNPNKPFSWRVNREQNAAQVFFFVNNWHDHLKAAPIGFTEAAGNFQRKNYSGNGVGHDAVMTNTDDGANTDHGLPDGNHVDNANMSTPPDGHAPRMQMYLQHVPGTRYPGGDPFSPTNVGDEADTVYHEYTHGLSNRLVVDADGNSTLGGVQAGSMGEAWSDWYAMDYLVAKKLEKDAPNVIDLYIFQYDGEGVFFDRTEPMDCKVGVSKPRCTGGTTGRTEGYTYGDYGNVIGFPEVHSDGEIWAQTLWDLRQKIGSKTSESLVTRAMSIAADNPSFLDMRNAILLADMATTGGDRQHAIWKVFANRGMGYFAGSLGGDDTAPGADFSMPPTGNDTGRITGTITDSQTGDPIEGAVVTVAFQGSPFVTNPSDTTGVSGTFNIGPIPRGTYPKVTFSAPGYDTVTRAVTLDQQNVASDAALDRDWASSAGGAELIDFTGPDFGQFCGPVAMIDQSSAFGWSTTSDLVDGQVGPDTPKQITVQLPNPVDISSITLLPMANCGDGQSASTGSYHIEVSTDGTTYNTVASDDLTFDEVTQLQTPTLTGSTDGIEFVRFWIDAPLVMVDTDTYGANPCPGGGFSGCDFEDAVEIEVYGTASP